MEAHGKQNGTATQDAVPQSWKEAKGESSYLVAEDFRGKTITAKILGLTKKEMEGEDGKVAWKFIFTLQGLPKPWVSNKTNNIIMEALYPGPPTVTIGHTIVLGTHMTHVGLGFIIVGADIPADRAVKVKLPRKKEREYTVKAMRATRAAPPSPAPKPTAPPSPKAEQDALRKGFLAACARPPLSYDEDTAVDWAMQLECLWTDPWTTAQIEVLQAAIQGQGGTWDGKGQQ